MLKRRLKEPFGKAGLIVAVVALVFAMLGGAYAATNNGGGKATASAKAKQGKQGKPGKTGPAGPQGPAGPAGAPGAKGDAGAAGANGSNGTNGTNGKGVTTGSASVAECASGGATVEVEGTPASKKKICNGQTGFTDTLPSGKTETGAWAFGIGTPEGKPATVPISFNIPLSAPLINPGECGQTGKEPCLAHYINHQGEEVVGPWYEPVILPTPSTACPGTVEEPSAEPGNFCIYALSDEQSQSQGGSQTIVEPGTGTSGVGTMGAVVSLKGGNSASADGTWAVTAP